MRLKLSESPVFRAMQEEGEIAGNPFVESFTYPGNKRRIFIALFGIAAGLTVIWYTATFSARSFLLSAMRVEETTANVIVGIGAALGMVFYVIFGQISDRFGRKKPIVIGYALTLLLLFPTFWFIGHHANPGLAQAAERAPIVVSGPDCSYNPFKPAQTSHCATLQGDLAGMGTSYKLGQGAALSMTVAGKALPLDSYPWESKDTKIRSAKLQEWLSADGYSFAKVTPSTGDCLAIIGALLVLMALSGATYGPVAALLSEMFPAKIRYSSMSIPYHIGTGYFGGFLPFIASWVIARTGDPYAGLWYTWIIVAVAFVVALWGLQGGLPRDFSDDAS
jgi:MFS family permease